MNDEKLRKNITHTMFEMFLKNYIFKACIQRWIGGIRVSLIAIIDGVHMKDRCLKVEYITKIILRGVRSEIRRTITRVLIRIAKF